jgi:hypothetical protein
MPAAITAGLLRFVAATLLFGALGLMWGERLAQAWLPLCQAEIALLDDTFSIDSLTLTKQGADRVIRMDIRPTRYFVLGERTVRPHPLARANSTTLVANLVLPAVLLLASGLAWPARRWWAYTLRLPLLAGVWLVLAAADVPLVLWGGIWGMYVDAYEPGLFSPLLIWVDMLQSGARLALPMVAGALTAWALERALSREPDHAQQALQAAA